VWLEPHVVLSAWVAAVAGEHAVGKEAEVVVLQAIPRVVGVPALFLVLSLLELQWFLHLRRPFS
jgi:hypothetical protein